LDGQLAGQFSQLGSGATDCGGHCVQSLLGLFAGEGEHALFASGARRDLQCLARAGEGVSLAVDELFDPEREFYFAPAVEPLAGAAFVGFEIGKLGLPETEHIWFHSADAGHVPYAKVKPIGNLG